ncbi:LysR family transcriptional regulator [Herbivorax sp. ANBcel31]|uniref:LysR family transcriptional regulator n=1 Tax=Herbivorax sp. ANBcel31 TaxID=3069754 RepID=UPI0027B441C4|nr:LysR family transcriptional regulator [Herbivorax sp. ANBcel31]MDQ2087463.1 LysR family transcriptional regulator [Herbivorax sp. ANBcel31]
MDINFELYKVFYYTAKNQSFSIAAKKLHISQSAVSQSIKSLEDKLGNQLFFRKIREIKLTPEGEVLFKHIEQAYNFIKSAENKILQFQTLERGEIRIGVSDTICKYYLIPYIQKFISKYPKVKIHVVNRTSLQIQQILKDGSIDFGIVTLPVDDKSLNIKNFVTLQDIFVASYKFSHLKGKKIFLKELVNYPLLMLDKSTSTRKNTDYFFTKNDLDITPEIELESIDLLLEFSKIGLGIALVLRESALDLIKNDNLFEVKLNESITPRKIGIITMKNVPLSRASLEFIANLNIQAPGGNSTQSEDL